MYLNFLHSQIQKKKEKFNRKLYEEIRYVERLGDYVTYVQDVKEKWPTNYNSFFSPSLGLLPNGSS